MDHSFCSTTQGWTQVFNLTIDEDATECPGEFQLLTPPEFNYSCGRTFELAPENEEGACYSANFSAYGINYTQISGRVYAYPTETLFSFVRTTDTINDPYVTGVSITTTPPRTHIWTFLADTSSIEVFNAGRDIFADDFFCEGDDDYLYYDDGYDEEYFSLDRHGTIDPLWDGEGCTGIPCCTSAPWFCQQLNEPTTSDIQVRICADNTNTISIFVLELYIQ